MSAIRGDVSRSGQRVLVPRSVLAPGMLLTFMASALVVTTALFATFGRTWSWTGFAGNENVWEWLQLLVQPLALVALLVQLVSPPHPRHWVTVGAVGAGVLAVLMVGGYALGWTWTGFDEYRLWDWLHLLVLPVMLALLPIWLRAGAPIGRHVQVALFCIAALLAAAAIGGYGWHWGWTGCTDKTFRDWLNLLIAPFLLPLACKWFLATHVGAQEALAGTDRLGEAGWAAAEARRHDGDEPARLGGAPAPEPADAS